MIPKADQSSRLGTSVGLDAGASLVKLAIREGTGTLRFESFPSWEIERAARRVEALAPARLGLTGAGAPELRRSLGFDTTSVVEFDAWRVGAGLLLARQGAAAIERDLLVSLGTGTSALLVEPDRTTRVGGTAIGGGTLLGLGAALVGVADFEELLALAARGDRRRVDLLVSDIDPSGELPLPRELPASALGRLARPQQGAAPRREDLAAALVGLVGDNVGLVCSAFAALTQARRILFGGSSLGERSPLRANLAAAGAAWGREVIFLTDGAHAGALGALDLADRKARDEANAEG